MHHCPTPTTITANIPLQTRKLSCPPNPRGEWLPASDRVELPDSDRCDDGSRDSPDPDVNLPHYLSLTQHFRALMSRAPLIRSSPALGSSSYGAVRIPQDSDDDANFTSPQPKNARQVSNGTSCISYESSPGGPSSGGRSSRPKRSHSSNRRKSSELYTEGHNRRPSSATSDIGMGADSKCSFATGLAVPGNPVLQETPVSSPYMTSDDEEDVLDIEDEDTKPADDDPPDNSP